MPGSRRSGAGARSADIYGRKLYSDRDADRTDPPSLYAYARNLTTGALQVLGPAGGPAGSWGSDSPVVSGDGTSVAYLYTPGAGVSDAYVRELQTGSDTQVDVTPADGQPNGAVGIDTDGSYVAFAAPEEQYSATAAAPAKRCLSHCRAPKNRPRHASMP